MKKIVTFMIILTMLCAFVGCKPKDDHKPFENPTGSSIWEGDSVYHLIQNNSSSYQIVLAENAKETEKYAAEELVKYIKQSTGVQLSVITDAAVTVNENTEFLSIGNTKVLRESQMNVPYQKLGTEGFVIETFGSNIILEGGQRGVLYSAYDFLERYFGVRFFAKDEIKVPQYQNVQVRETKIVEIPAFAGRDSHYKEMRMEGDFSAKLRYNGVATPLEEKHGYGSKTEWSSEWSHSFFKLLPPTMYYGDHSEWYSHAGVIAGQNGQLCLTNIDARKELTENLKQWILNQPDAIHFSVSQEDIAPPCSCKNCQESNRKYQNSGTLIRFVNAVAKDIEEWAKVTCPEREIYINTFAYQFTQTPPVKKENGKIAAIDETVVPADNVIIRMTDINSCFYHSLNDVNCAENAQFRADFEGWKALTNRFFMWTYCTNFSNYLLSFDNWGAIQANYQFFYESGVINLMDQGAYDTYHSEFQEMREYVQAKMMWNPWQDMRALIDEFIEGYYQQGAEEVKTYFATMRENYSRVAQKSNGGFHIKLYSVPDITASTNYTVDVLETMMSAMQTAAAKYDSEPDVALKEKMQNRFLALSLSPRYIVLRNYLIFYDYSTQRDFALKFFDDCDRVGIERYAEACSMLELRNQYL